MKTAVIGLAALLCSTSLFAEDVSDECLQCMQGVYKFYYQDVQPKGGAKSAQLTPAQATRMQAVIGDLKNQCPPTMVVKMNEFLKNDTA